MKLRGRLHRMIGVQTKAANISPALRFNDNANICATAV